MRIHIGVDDMPLAGDVSTCKYSANAPVKLDNIEGVVVNVKEVNGVGEHPLAGPQFRKCKQVLVIFEA